jgi:hypothetical protein
MKAIEIAIYLSSLYYDIVINKVTTAKINTLFFMDNLPFPFNNFDRDINTNINNNGLLQNVDKSSQSKLQNQTQPSSEYSNDSTEESLNKKQKN